MNFHGTRGKNRAWNMGGPIKCCGTAEDFFFKLVVFFFYYCKIEYYPALSCFLKKYTQVKTGLVRLIFRKSIRKNVKKK